MEEVKEVKETKVKKTAEKKVTKTSKKGKYFYAVGRRKTSVAQVRIFPSDKVGEEDYIVNNRDMKEYFSGTIMQATFVSPFKETGLVDKFKVSVIVRGGGISSQVEAVRLGVARALIKFDETLRPVLKANGFLTRDSRKVERKKPGLKKARRAPQWAKR
ncbi:MAG: 30S ribosomal protein S9 [Candidatus Moranbacteria bacterium]|nr:30S ribosomal protein S9 [Candidatus Moranbacteria bacterium]